MNIFKHDRSFNRVLNEGRFSSPACTNSTRVPPSLCNVTQTFCSENLDARTVVNGSLDFAAREIVLQALIFYLAIQDAATEFRYAGQMHRARDARAVDCHSFVRRVAIHRVTRDSRTYWRAVSTEAFALYVIVAGFGCASKNFPKRAHKRACSRLVRIM
jgi:hypothetical protein